MVSNNNKYYDDIRDKLNVSNVYVNEYDSKYIVLDDLNLSLYDKDYGFMFSISKNKVCDIKQKYDIIYRKEDFMYIHSYYEGDNLVYEFYNIYNCKLEDKIVLRG